MLLQPASATLRAIEDLLTDEAVGQIMAMSAAKALTQAVEYATPAVAAGEGEPEPLAPIVARRRVESDACNVSASSRQEARVEIIWKDVLKRG